MKIAFLDRDGIINCPKGDYYVYKKERFFLTLNIISLLKEIKKRDYKFVVISNQGGIGRGLYEKKDVDILHSYMIEMLANEGIEILDIYYCPHHPETSDCLCRKPSPLMIEKALHRFKADKKTSFMIGDSPRDIAAAESAGIKGIKTESCKINIEEIIEQIDCL